MAQQGKFFLGMGMKEDIGQFQHIYWPKSGFFPVAFSMKGQVNRINGELIGQGWCKRQKTPAIIGKTWEGQQ